MGIYANTNNAIGSSFQANQQQKQLVKYVPDRLLYVQSEKILRAFFSFSLFPLVENATYNWLIFFSCCQEVYSCIQTNHILIAISIYLKIGIFYGNSFQEIHFHYKLI